MTSAPGFSRRDLDFSLPEDLIATRPPEARDGARLLVVDREAGTIEQHTVQNLPHVLPPSLWVFNDTRVFKARVRVRSENGASGELLFIRRRLEDEGLVWEAMGKPAKRLKPGASLRLEANPDVVVRIREQQGEGFYLVEVPEALQYEERVDRYGVLPLPPYMSRDATLEDEERYQTMFARHSGSVAAPTASLHFTPELIQALAAKGHTRTQLTLHVGPGTFLPIRAENLDDHVMHTERFSVPTIAGDAIRNARRNAVPVVAVGTTVTRTLEAVAEKDGVLRPGDGQTDIFIRPGFRFRMVDTLVTNFHLPDSTLLALVMAFASTSRTGEVDVRRGVDLVKRAYAFAIKERFRFYSYGDAMLLR